MSGPWRTPDAPEHVAVDPVLLAGTGGDRPVYLAHCSCGWVAEVRGWCREDDASSSFALHREDVMKPEANACRYCFATIPWGGLFCGDQCRKASNKRPDSDAAAEVLDRHRDDEEERIMPSPDQGALW